MKQFSNVKKLIASTLLGLFAIAFFWQSAFLSSNVAMANSTVNSLILADTGSEVQSKVSKDTGRTKSFIEDAKDTVKDAARSNANKVDKATDNDSVIGRKAQRDAARIQDKADKDAARTKEAVDDTKNVIERAVEGIKDTFN